MFMFKSFTTKMKDYRNTRTKCLCKDGFFLTSNCSTYKADDFTVVCSALKSLQYSVPSMTSMSTSSTTRRRTMSRTMRAIRITWATGWWNTFLILALQLRVNNSNINNHNNRSNQNTINNNSKKIPLSNSIKKAKKTKNTNENQQHTETEYVRTCNAINQIDLKIVLLYFNILMDFSLRNIY